MSQGGRDLAWAMALQEIDDKAQAGLVRQRKCEEANCHGHEGGAI